VEQSPTLHSSELVRGLQERAARALPAEHVKDSDGWTLRHAPGCSWWIGTALPHGATGPDDLLRRVAEAEQFYAAHGATARFQLTPGASPAALDPLLARRGYRRSGPISLQVAGIAATPAAAQLTDHPTRGWFDTWSAARGHDDSAAEWDLLGRVDLPSAYVCLHEGSDVVAVGRAVADTGWAGVFGMATLPRARGRGAARTVLATLANWAGAHGADRLYLQVERDNVAAMRLYQRAGFSELCEYHYRTAD
jgi:GNAT superfamily N-acetyltransferase